MSSQKAPIKIKLNKKKYNPSYYKKKMIGGFMKDTIMNSYLTKLIVFKKIIYISLKLLY